MHKDVCDTLSVSLANVSGVDAIIIFQMTCFIWDEGVRHLIYVQGLSLLGGGGATPMSYSHVRLNYAVTS